MEKKKKKKKKWFFPAFGYGLSHHSPTTSTSGDEETSDGSDISVSEMFFHMMRDDILAECESEEERQRIGELFERNYKREYEKYHKSSKQKKRRAQRNKARRKLEREGKVHKGDGKDIDHKNHNTEDLSSKNLKVMSKSKNRAKNKGRGGRPKGS